MSQHHERTPLNGSRRRARKRTLAARDGSWCAYCGRLFADLAAATIDHVVPISLFPTWNAEHTVLACRSCNSRKSNRLPLLLAVLLTTTHGAPDASADGTHSDLRDEPRHTGVTPASAGLRAHDQTHPRDVRTVGFWVLLARLASAAESADLMADRPHQQLRTAQPVHAPARTARTESVPLSVSTRLPDSTTRSDRTREAA